jgi:hypothetical protein
MMTQQPFSRLTARLPGGGRRRHILDQDFVCALHPNGATPRRVSERFYVELAPGFVRLRHELGVRALFGRRRLGPIQEQIVRSMTETDRSGQTIEWGEPDPVEFAELLADEEQARREAEEGYLESLGPLSVDELIEARDLLRAKQAATERLGRGAKGMSDRSRREMWRWVLPNLSPLISATRIPARPNRSTSSSRRPTSESPQIPTRLP